MTRTETQVSAQPPVVASTLYGDSENSSHQQTPDTARNTVGRDRQTTAASTNIRLSGARPRQSSVPVAVPVAQSTSAPWMMVVMTVLRGLPASSRRRRQVINGTGTAETAQQNARRLRVIQPTTKIFVSRLDPATTEAELTDCVKDVTHILPSFLLFQLMSKI